MRDLNRTDREILRALRDGSGRGDTTDIRAWIRETRGEDMSNSNIGKRAKALAEQNLIETVGERDVGAPIPANVYALTDLGIEAVEQIESSTDRAVSVGVSSERVAEIEDGVEGLRESMDRFEEAIRTLDKRTARLYELTEGTERTEMVTNDR